MSVKQSHILIVDPTKLIAIGLEAVINQSESYYTEIAECLDVEDLVSAVTLVRPDLLIVNPLIAGIRIDSTLVSKYDGPVVALLYANMRTLSLLGYRHTIAVDMDPKEIVNSINNVLMQDDEAEEIMSETFLSPREEEVVILVAKGMTNKEIARQLSLSIHTVITHRRNITKKLGIHSVSGLTMYAIMNQLVSLEETNMK